MMKRVATSAGAYLRRSCKKRVYIYIRVLEKIHDVKGVHLPEKVHDEAPVHIPEEVHTEEDVHVTENGARGRGRL
jgi:hypothetical protein